MENLVVVSKVKKYIKTKAGFNTSASFFEVLAKDISHALSEGVNSAKTNGRKTLMGRDLNFFISEPNIDEVLVVASKIKKFVKDNSELSTSSQVPEQLTVRVQRLCDIAIENAKSSKRKTVMDKDYAPIQASL